MKRVAWQQNLEILSHTFDKDDGPVLHYRLFRAGQDLLLGAFRINLDYCGRVYFADERIDASHGDLPVSIVAELMTRRALVGSESLDSILIGHGEAQHCGNTAIRGNMFS